MKKIAILLGALMPMALFAGAVLTSNGQARVGKVEQDGKIVKFKVKFGYIKYKPEALRWHTTDAKVTSCYKAGRAALKANKFDVAEIFLNLSLKNEPKTKAYATDLLEELKKRKRRWHEADKELEAFVGSEG